VNNTVKTNSADYKITKKINLTNTFLLTLLILSCIIILPVSAWNTSDRTVYNLDGFTVDLPEANYSAYCTEKGSTGYTAIYISFRKVQSGGSYNTICNAAGDCAIPLSSSLRPNRTPAQMQADYAASYRYYDIQPYCNGGTPLTPPIEDYPMDTGTGIPVVSFTASNSTGVGTAIVTFNDTSSNSAPTQWVWNATNVTGNNTPFTFSSSKNTTYTFGTGNFSISLNASNSRGNNISTQISFVNVSTSPIIIPPVTTNFIGSPLNGTAPLLVSFTDLSTGTPSVWAWFFGDETYGQSWVERTGGASWGARTSHCTVALPDGSIVLMGGHISSGYKNDVWRSTNGGITWTQQTEHAGWSERLISDRCVVLSDGSIVVMGGEIPTGTTNDTWRSTDKGVNWTLMTGSSGWSKRYGSSVAALPDGSIVLMGGHISSGYKNDVWRSTDKGATWTLRNASAAWPARWNQNSVGLPDGSLIMAGGQIGWPGEQIDVWRSTDQGVLWSQMTASAEWPARYLQSTVAMPDGSLIMAGGVYGEGYTLDDVWRSTNNGANWTLLGGTSGWSPRNAFGMSVLSNGSIMLMGGYTQYGEMNDVWVFSPQGSNVQNPTHSYTTTGMYNVALKSSNTTATNTTATNSTLKYEYINVSGYGSPVSAEFYSNITRGGIPLHVQFMDSSTNSPTSWLWDFGDSTNSTDQNPVHIYTLNGTFDVSLTSGKDGSFNSTIKSSYITASADPPISNFMAIPTEGDYPLIVTFYDQSTSTPTSWDWDFGDGTAHSTEQNPTHLYEFENQYTVKLVVSNTYGESDLTRPYYIDVTAVEGQMLTRPVNVNLSSNCVRFYGTNLGEPITVWFEYGMIQDYTNGYKSFKTENQTDITGNFSYTHCGIPILPGEAYKVHAAGDIGGVYVYGMNRTFVIPDLVPHPTTTYEEQVDIFVEDGLAPVDLLTYDVWQPYLGLMGGLFFAILIAFIFMNIVIKQRTVALTIITLLLTGVAIWQLLPPEFIKIAQMLFIAGIAGLLYWLFMKRR